MEQYIPTGTFAKIILSAGVLGLFGAYAIHQKTEVEEHSPVAVVTPAPNIIRTPLPNPLGIKPSGPVATIAPTPLVTSTGRSSYKDGSYTGNIADAFYGPVQVKAIISGGRIVDVKFLQYPNDRQTSIEINSQAMPFLIQEAIQVQSAQVDGVSGATQTSRAFKESLGVALNQAI